MCIAHHTPLLFFLSPPPPHPHLHSFPTRRSSDLALAHCSPPVGDCGWRSQANCNVSGEKLVKGTERGQTVSLTAQNGRATGGSRSVPLAPLAILRGR